MHFFRKKKVLLASYHIISLLRIGCQYTLYKNKYNNPILLAIYDEAKQNLPKKDAAGSIPPVE